jgi:hypothetical protein
MEKASVLTTFILGDFRKKFGLKHSGVAEY